MKRRLFSILMILTLCMALLPLPAAAAAPDLDLTATPLPSLTGCTWDDSTGDGALTLANVALGDITLPEYVATPSTYSVITIEIEGNVTVNSISGATLNTVRIKGVGESPSLSVTENISGSNVTGNLIFENINASVGNIVWSSTDEDYPNKVQSIGNSTLTITGNDGSGLYAGGVWIEQTSRIVLSGGWIGSQFASGINELISLFLPDGDDYSAGQVDGAGDYYLYKNGSRVTSDTLKKYITLTFDANGGTPVPAQRVAYGGTATEPAPPTRDGFTFAGWYLVLPEAEIPFVFGTAVVEDMPLKAHWTENTETDPDEDEDPTPPPTPSDSSEDDNSPIVYYITAKEAANGTVTPSVRSAYAGETVTVTAAPDEDYTLDSLTAADQKGNTLTLTDKGNGTYTFTMPYSNVSVSAVFKSEKAAPAPTNPFGDVPPGKYYEEPVKWAVENGITSGRDATHFDPDSTCTRGQLVTFLWRAVGCPTEDGAALTFSDVRTGAYYAAAVRWAAAHGIVMGYSDGTFRPDNTITRQQAAAILYRYAVYRGMDVSVGEDTNILSFNDAMSVSEYAVSAMQWAVGAEILQGNGGNLLPRSGCTRAQIVTMLYRLLVR